MRRAVGNRHGITFAPQRAPVSMSDVQSLVHMAVPRRVATEWESASGGVARTVEEAELAAIGEAIERYCASIVPLPERPRDSIDKRHRIDAEEWCLFSPEQRSHPDFPFHAIYSPTCAYTEVTDLATQQPVWVPQPLVPLRDDYDTGAPTSSGLAAGPTATHAMLRAVQELIERDALMVTWLHSIPGRAVTMPQHYLDEVSALAGECYAFDLTPAYSPFPVIAVAGMIPQRGTPRFSLGVACRDTWEQAMDKAYLEWNQGVLFAGIYRPRADRDRLSTPGKVRSFDDHAIYYTLHPDQWDTIPLLRDRDTHHPISVPGREREPQASLDLAVTELSKNGIRVLGRDLTTVDALQVGVRVARALSPDLAPIFAHQDWPMLGWVERMVHHRYPWAEPGGHPFPNPLPHPLG